jgi:hypothetical protein
VTELASILKSIPFSLHHTELIILLASPALTILKECSLSLSEEAKLKNVLTI